MDFQFIVVAHASMMAVGFRSSWLVAARHPRWPLGKLMRILGRHLWSFAGDENRADVNQSLIEPFANYNLD